MTRHTLETPYLFAPDAKSVQELYDHLSALAKSAIAEKESNEASDKSETFAQNTFRSVLHQVINIVDSEATPKRSVGIGWLSHGQNRVLVRQIIPAEERLTFFKAHLINRHITDMLEHHGVLQLIPNAERTEFVRAVLGHWIPGSDAWIPGVLNAQSNPSTPSLAMLYWLRHPEEFEGGDAFAARFLRTGPGKALYVPSGYWTMSFNSHTLWSVFTGDDLWEALSICAEREPNVFFEAPAKDDIPVSRKVQLRLTVGERASGLLDLAIRNLQSRDGLSARGFDCLTRKAKLTVIRRPEICPLPLLVKFALHYVESDGYEVFRSHVGKITSQCTDYAADLTESLAYIRETEELKRGAPYIGSLVRMRETLLRNAPMHGVDPSKLDL
ncbi:MAG TPA: hypothetical protein VJ843_03395 [Candidatus Saccharimonadales bacterium]|nr:hypothetical protein [Candidatus Saccharimonadales bacterium]